MLLVSNTPWLWNAYICADVAKAMNLLLTTYSPITNSLLVIEDAVQGCMTFAMSWWSKAWIFVSKVYNWYIMNKQLVSYHTRQSFMLVCRYVRPFPWMALIWLVVHSLFRHKQESVQCSPPSCHDNQKFGAGTFITMHKAYSNSWDCILMLQTNYLATECNVIILGKGQKLAIALMYWGMR